MPTCNTCGNTFPNWTNVDGKRRNLCNRTLCLDCLPFQSKSAFPKCLCCGKSLDRMRRKYCSNACQGKVRVSETWKAITATSIDVSPETLRKHIIQQRGERCERCCLSKWQGSPIPVDLHHIDGNNENNAVENLSLLCKNCHALTDNYGVKNIGRGRKSRRMIRGGMC
jgi:hypothetical protein